MSGVSRSDLLSLDALDFGLTALLRLREEYGSGISRSKAR
jgi:hypothetical protein